MKKTIFVVLIFLLALVAAYFLSVKRSLSSHWVINEGHLNSEQVDEVLLALRSEQLPELVYSSPELTAWLLDKLSVVDFDGKASDKESIELAKYAELMSEIHRIGRWHQVPGWYRDVYSNGDSSMSRQFQGACKKWLNHIRISQWALTPEEDAVFAQVVSASRIHGNACLSEDELIALYKGTVARKEGFLQTSKSALHEIWLGYYSGEYPNQTKVLNSVRIVEDLIHLIGHESTEVSIASLKVIAILTPDAALPALRTHLVRSQNEAVQLAIVEAMTGYGTKLRPYWEQLRLLQRAVKSDEVRISIQQLIEKSSGH